MKEKVLKKGQMVEQQNEHIDKEVEIIKRNQKKFRM